MYLNTAKTLELIKKFEMIAPPNEQFNNFELKFLKAQHPKDKNEGSDYIPSYNVRESMSVG